MPRPVEWELLELWRNGRVWVLVLVLIWSGHFWREAWKARVPAPVAVSPRPAGPPAQHVDFLTIARLSLDATRVRDAEAARLITLMEHQLGDPLRCEQGAADLCLCDLWRAARRLSLCAADAEAPVKTHLERLVQTAGAAADDPAFVASWRKASEEGSRAMWRCAGAANEVHVRCTDLPPLHRLFHVAPPQPLDSTQYVAPPRPLAPGRGVHEGQ